MLSVDCPQCGKTLRAPENSAGKRAKCPSCAGTVVVPAEPIAGMRGAAVAPARSDAGTAGDGMRSCPSCSRSIRAEATKCRFCGKTLTSSSSGAPVELQPLGVAPSAEDVYPVLPIEKPPAPAHAEHVEHADEMTFEGKYTPSIALLPGERVVDVITATGLGLFAWLLGHKLRLVLTTHRLVRFEKRAFDCSFAVVWLRAVKLVVAGRVVNAWQFGLGVAAVVSGLATLVYAVVAGSKATENAQVVGAVVTIIVGILFIVLSRRKVMLVSTGEDKTGLTLIGLTAEQLKRFVDGVFASLAERDASP